MISKTPSEMMGFCCVNLTYWSNYGIIVTYTNYVMENGSVSQNRNNRRVNINVQRKAV